MLISRRKRDVCCVTCQAESDGRSGAAELRTGNIIWNTESPNASVAIGPPSVAGNVAWFAREDANHAPKEYEKTGGGLIPVDKDTGCIIRDYGLEWIMHGVISVADNYVLFGTGYHKPYKRNGAIHVYMA